jgi:hypothetical protein
MNEPPKDVSFKKLLGKAQLKFKYSVVKTCAVQTNIFGGWGPFCGPQRQMGSACESGCPTVQLFSAMSVFQCLPLLLLGKLL